MTKTQLRHEVRNANRMIASGTLTLVEMQKAILKRETAYSAIKSLQTGVSQKSVDRLVSIAGIQTLKSSGENRTTWNDSAYTEYALRGCGLRQMPMSFRHNRVGATRVVHNLKNLDSSGKEGRVIRSRKGGRKIIPSASVSTMYSEAKASANFREKAKELPRIIRGGQGERVAMDLSAYVSQSAINRATAAKRGKAMRGE